MRGDRTDYRYGLHDLMAKKATKKTPAKKAPAKKTRAKAAPKKAAPKKAPSKRPEPKIDVNEPLHIPTFLVRKVNNEKCSLTSDSGVLYKVSETGVWYYAENDKKVPKTKIPKEKSNGRF